MSSKRTNNAFQLASAMCMVLALLWLTISTPFVYASQQKMATYQTKSISISDCNDVEDASKPLTNSTEEKNSNGNSFSEEYLQHHHEDDYFISISAQYHNCINAGTYTAFHGELLVPPPDFI